MADRISGRAHAATVGATWIVDQKTSAQASLLVGNADGRADGLQLGITRQFGW